MKKLLNWFTKEESGQGMVEYALIIALIAIVVIVVLTALGGSINSVFGRANEQLSHVVTG